MSDLREPRERLVEFKEIDLGPIPPKRSLVSTVSNVLAPLRRVALNQPWPLARKPAPEIDHQPDFGTQTQTGGGSRLIIISLILVVLLPALASGTYLFFLASDQYAAEARFAVRANNISFSGSSGSDSKSGDTSLSGLMSGAGSLGSQDAYIVADYVHSRAIIDDISRTIDLRALFRRPEADFVARLSSNASAEDLTDYWKKMVSVYVETTSGIVTVETRAFRRDDALLLANAIVKSSETLVNDLSTNVHADAMKHAEEELKRSEALVRLALDDLTAFRNSQGLIDPVKSADLNGKLLLQLMADEIQTESQLFVSLRVMGPNAPGIEGTRIKLESIKNHIASLKEQMAGKGNAGNMAASISRFEQLELKRLFAERMYGFAQDGINRARMIAEARSVYLAVFAPPTLPQDYSYPLRFSDFALITIAAFIAWCSGATIWASVLDHRL